MRQPGQTAVVPAGAAPDRIDRWLPLLFGLSRTRARKVIDAGGVYLDGKRCRTQSRTVGPGTRLEVIEEAPPASQGPSPRLVHRDRHILVLDKPPGVPCQPTRGNVHGTVEQWVRDLPGVRYTALHHRLDRPASGLLVVAIGREANAGLARSFSERLAVRRYRALVAGEVAGESGTWRHALVEHDGDRRAAPEGSEGLEMIADWSVERRLDDKTTLLEVRLQTGRTHQIRLQAAATGTPIVGDRRYGGAEPGPLRLQAFGLALDHPVTGEALAFTLGPPPDWGLPPAT